MTGKSVQRAREMRKTMTPPELTLWLQLRALRPEGWHFRRQLPETGYILDLCAEGRSSSSKLTARTIHRLNNRPTIDGATNS